MTLYLKDIKHGSSDCTRLRDETGNVMCLLEMLKDRINDWESSGHDALKPGSISSLIVPDGPLSLFKRTLEHVAKKLAPQDRLRRMTQPGTGQWFLQGDVFLKWVL